MSKEESSQCLSVIMFLPASPKVGQRNKHIDVTSFRWLSALVLLNHGRSDITETYLRNDKCLDNLCTIASIFCLNDFWYIYNHPFVQILGETVKSLYSDWGLNFFSFHANALAGNYDLLALQIFIPLDPMIKGANCFWAVHPFVTVTASVTKL